MATPSELKMALERPFEVDRVHWRIGSTTKDKTKGMALAYVNARDVMKRLDDVLGPENWQRRYTHVVNGLVICEVGVRFGDDWIWKADGAGQTDHEGEKGSTSDSFKRAAVNFGVARYLYSLPNEWVAIKPAGRSYTLAAKPSLPKWATPDGYDQIMAGKFTPEPEAGANEAEMSLRECGSLDDLQTAWKALTPDQRKALATVKNEVKEQLAEPA